MLSFLSHDQIGNGNLCVVGVGTSRINAKILTLWYIFYAFLFGQSKCFWAVFKCIGVRWCYNDMSVKIEVIITLTWGFVKA